MIKSILNAICDTIAACTTFRTCPIEISDIGQGFTRPSFYISLAGLTGDDLNIGVYKDNLSFQIVYFCSLDDHKNVDVETQLDHYQILRGLFTKGFITVGDRAPKILRIEGGPRDNEIYLTLNIDFTADKAPIDTTVYLKVGEVNISVKKI